MTSLGRDSVRDRADSPSGEVGLFVLWETSRGYMDEVVSDITREFAVMAGYEIHWTPKLVGRNFERFYCDVSIRGVYHRINKGSGPFVALVVLDRTPVYAPRETSRGLRRVNVHLSELKQRYRERHQDLGLHCSETAAEATRDLTLLLGADTADMADGPEWDGQLLPLRRDVTGAHGWESVHQLFQTLNRSVDYVVLGPAEQRVGHGLRAGSGPTLLSSDHRTLVRVVNGAPRRGLRARHGGRFLVEIEGRRVPIDVRSVEEGFMDRDWALHCLNERTPSADEDVYRPPHPDDVASGWYLSAIADSGGGDGGDAGAGVRGDDSDGADIDRRMELRDFMRDRGYDHPRPADRLVPWNDIFAPGPPKSSPAGRLRIRVIRGLRGLAVFLRTGYLGARDEIVFRAPRLRSLVRQATRS